MPNGSPYGGTRVCDVVPYGSADVNLRAERRNDPPIGFDVGHTHRLLAT